MSDSRMGWSNTLTEGLMRVKETVHAHAEDAMAEGAKVVFARSEELVPKVTGDLAGSGGIEQHRGGTNTVAITYSSVYSRYIHEHLFFKHPHGGAAKFLELAMIEKGSEAIQVAGESLWSHL